MWIEETSRPKVERYWDVQFPNRDHIETRSVDEMIETVRDIIVETVKLRLRADVKTAIYLSGGIGDRLQRANPFHLKRGRQFGHSGNCTE